MKTEKRNTTGLWITITIFGIIIFFSAILNLALIAIVGQNSGGNDALNIGNKPIHEFPIFEEVWTYGHGTTKVAHIQFNGAIMRQTESSGFFPKPDQVSATLSQIRAAKNDLDVKAIIFEINSPGGAVTASDEIYSALLDFRHSDEGRKVLIFTRDMAASGAFYIAMAGNRFVAERTSIIGSVGVIMQSMNFEKLAKKIGVTDVTITAGKNKDILNPFKPVKESHLKNLQNLVDDSYMQFLDLVLEARPNINPDFLDGRIYSANEALKLGMIDEIGYWDDAIVATAKLLGEENVQVFQYEEQIGFAELFMQMKFPEVPAMLSNQRPQMLYMWQP